MIGKKEIFEKIGKFPEFRKARGYAYENNKAGRYYANLIARAGYSFIIPKEPLAYDMGLGQHSYL